MPQTLGLYMNNFVVVYGAQLCKPILLYQLLSIVESHLYPVFYHLEDNTTVKLFSLCVLSFLESLRKVPLYIDCAGN